MNHHDFKIYIRLIQLQFQLDKTQKQLKRLRSYRFYPLRFLYPLLLVFSILLMFPTATAINKIDSASFHL